MLNGDDGDLGCSKISRIIMCRNESESQQCRTLVDGRINVSYCRVLSRIMLQIAFSFHLLLYFFLPPRLLLFSLLHSRFYFVHFTLTSFVLLTTKVDFGLDSLVQIHASRKKNKENTLQQKLNYIPWELLFCGLELYFHSLKFHSNNAMRSRGLFFNILTLVVHFTILIFAQSTISTRLLDGVL